MIGKGHLTARLAELTRDPSAPVTARAALHRDLGWLLWVHLGDSEAARKEWEKALSLVGDAGRETSPRTTPTSAPLAPWVHAGLAATSSLALSVSAAARAWVEVLVHVGRWRDPEAPRLEPPIGLDVNALARLALDQLMDQMRYLDREEVEALMRRVSSANLPPLLSSTLAQVQMDLARRAGDLEAIRRSQTRAGCPASYVISPRFGRYPRLDLATTFAPDREAVLSGRRAIAAGCRLTLRSADGVGGVRYVETVVSSARGGPGVLKLAFPQPVVVWVGGRLVHERDPEELPRPLVRVIPVTLQPGENRVRLKVPVSASPQQLHLLLVRDPEGSVARAAAGPRAGTGRRAGTGKGAEKGAGAITPDGRAQSPLVATQAHTYRPLGYVLSVSDALHMGLPDAGRDPAERLLREAPRFSLGLVTVAHLEELDPMQPTALGRERARPLLSRIVRDQPNAARARMRLASLLRQQDKSREALLLLAAAPKGTTDPARLLAYARIELYLDLGWRALAAREAQSLCREHPRWVAAWQLLYRLSRMEHAAPLLSEAAGRLRELDASSLALAELLATQGKIPEALAELERVDKVTGGRSTARESQWLRLAGSEEKARTRLIRHLAAAHWDPERRIALADVLVALGQREEAARLLSEGLATHPEHLDYRRALAALSRPHPLHAHRVDGLAAIAAYRKAAWSPGARPVHVLDRAAMRVMPSGARLVLTHQIVHLRTKEDVHGYAEVRLPHEAEVLTLRTVKADGSTREPEDLTGKQTVSLPDVDVGDFIEAEYVSASPAEPWWRPGGFFGGQFFFQSVSAHYFRSELVVVTEPGHPLTLSPTGGAPTPVESTQDGLRVLKLTANRVERLEPEPLSTHLAGILPSVQMGAQVRWQDFLAQRRELVWGQAAVTHHVRTIAKEVCQGPPGDRARRAFAWVQANIEERGGLGVSAAATAAGRSGSRLNLLAALFAACGFKDVRTHLVWARHLEHQAGIMPPVQSFSQAVLGVTVPGEGHVLLLPQLQQTPFGYLPPAFQGALAVTVERPGEPPRRLPENPKADAHETRLKVMLRKDGSAVISGEDHLSGLVGVQLRAAHRSVPQKRLRQALEQSFFARHFAGATLTMLSFEHASDPDKPLVLRYRLEVPALALAVGNRLILETPFFPTRLGRQFGALPTRRLPLQLGPVGPRRVTVDIEAPAGYALSEEPTQINIQSTKGPVAVTAQSTRKPVAVDTPYGQLRLTLARTKTGARMVRSLHVPYRVVPPADYARFTAVAAGLDRLETPTLVFQR